MPRDIAVIQNEHDTLLNNARVWQELVRGQIRSVSIVTMERVALYNNLIDDAIDLIIALRKELKDHPNTQNPENGDDVDPLPIEEETNNEMANTEPANTFVVGGKRQKKRKSKKQMKKRKSGKKTRRSKK